MMPACQKTGNALYKNGLRFLTKKNGDDFLHTLSR